MKIYWFKRYGMFFIPVAWPGWIILAAAFCYAVYLFCDIDSRSHSVSDTLINFFLYLLIIGAAYSMIGLIAGKEKE